MNRLQNNPHYKPNKKQQEELHTEVSSVEFGTPDIHNNTFPVHQTEEKKNRKRRPAKKTGV